MVGFAWVWLMIMQKMIDVGRKLSASFSKTVDEHPIKLIVGYAMAFVPIVLEALFRDVELICPHHRTKLYSALLLFSPFVSVMLVALILAAQFYGHLSSTDGSQAVISKLFPGMLIMIFTSGITLGASFIKGASFACMMLGAPQLKDYHASAIYKRDFVSMISTSRIIGWFVIWVTLMGMFVGMVVRYSCFKPSRTQILKSQFNRIRIAETRRLIKEKFECIGKDAAGGTLTATFEAIDEMSSQVLALMKQLNTILEDEVGRQLEHVFSRSNFNKYKNSLQAPLLE